MNNTLYRAWRLFKNPGGNKMVNLRCGASYSYDKRDVTRTEYFIRKTGHRMVVEHGRIWFPEHKEDLRTLSEYWTHPKYKDCLCAKIARCIVAKETTRSVGLRPSHLDSWSEVVFEINKMRSDGRVMFRKPGLRKHVHYFEEAALTLYERLTRRGLNKANHKFLSRLRTRRQELSEYVRAVDVPDPDFEPGEHVVECLVLKIGNRHRSRQECKIHVSSKGQISLLSHPDMTVQTMLTYGKLMGEKQHDSPCPCFRVLADLTDTYTGLFDAGPSMLVSNIRKLRDARRDAKSCNDIYASARFGPGKVLVQRHALLARFNNDVHAKIRRVCAKLGIRG